MPDRRDGLKVLEHHTGKAVIESYTVIPGKRGTTAPVAALTVAGDRIAAMVRPEDDKTIAAMQSDEPIGRSIDVRAADDGRNFYIFID